MPNMTQLLLEEGADTETNNQDGKKPLYMASESGKLGLVELLLQYNANVDSLNRKAERTAFHRAIENGHLDVAKALLNSGADIDSPMSSNGETSLLSAVSRRDHRTVSFLLQNGANKRICDDNGHMAEDLASEGTGIMDLLQSDLLLQGPSITNPKTNPEARFTVPSIPADQIDKINACRGFDGTIVDFFVRESEQRIQKTASIYEMLYGKGPEAIMNAAKGTRLEEQKRSFRWYHLPANNVRFFIRCISIHNLSLILI
ncbi:hypothetical protein NHQ30_010771 [Ciborinia camelliae]|nr:hypothetical protein NHQ30_010771 [Ciborinia camelliae]